VAAVFVPIVVGVAAATFLGWAVFGPEPRLALALVKSPASGFLSTAKRDREDG